jgi:hypothetical protein
MKKVQPWVQPSIHIGALVGAGFHSGHQTWLFFDDEELEFPRGIGSMTSTTMHLKKFQLLPFHHHQIIRFPNLQTQNKHKTKPQIGT